MASFVMLLKFTDQGITTVKDSPARAAAFRAAAAKAGATVTAQYWLLGEYDGAVVFTAPDEATATAVALGLGALGNVRTCLCRAFDEAEFKAIVAKV
jgi:uncharacterized protein with GYD domain